VQNLSELTRRLVDAQVEFVLIGGFAAVAHGVTLVTRDVDICCRFDQANLQRIQGALADLHPVHRSRPDLPFLFTPELCTGLKNLYLKTDLGILDCLGEVLGIGVFDEVLRQSVKVDLPFGTCRILDLEGLIRAKQAMGRDHDRITVAQLNAIRARLGEPGSQ
jgi:predicted nucleotidyltransferase